MPSNPVVDTRLPEPTTSLVVSITKDVKLDESRLKTHLNELNRALYRLAFDPNKNGRFVIFTEHTGDADVPAGGEVIIFDISAVAVATLPDPTTNLGHAYSIVNKYTSTANVTFSEDINGDSTFMLLPQEPITIFSNGTEYLMYE